MNKTCLYIAVVGVAIILAAPARGETPGSSPTPGPTAPPTPLPTPTATFTPVPEPDYSAAVSNLDTYLRDRLGKDNVKGFSLALVDGDRVVWVKGYGRVDPDREGPAAGDTRYRLGAASELFTAVEAMRWVERGSLDLDAPLTAALPGFSIQSRFPKAKPITPRALLAQHSGLPGFFYQGMWADPGQSLAGLAADLRRDYLVAPPQTLYRYSYLDFDLLGRIVELKSGKPFAAALRSDLFHPLGMEDSFFGEDPGSDLPPAPPCRDGHPIPPLHYRDVPAVGMVSTANDLAKFLRFVLGGAADPGPAPLDRTTRASMLLPQYPGLPLDFGQSLGLGWRLSGLTVFGAGEAAWRGGEYPGYTSQVAILPDQKLGVAFLSNSNEADKLAGQAVQRAFQLMLQAKYGKTPVLERPKPRMPPVAAVPTETLDRVAGDYSALGQLVRIARQDNHLTAAFAKYRVDLLPVDQQTFVPHLVFLLLFPVDLPQYPLTFSTAGDQAVATLGGLPFVLPLEKIEPVPIPDAWRAREGDYVQENPEPQLQFGSIR
ncbi:MAG TPA: serine hydrolase domain-containing protein, partial [bacterium]|nr:serine hydrolase domain-containing protein [bacterium]